MISHKDLASGSIEGKGVFKISAQSQRHIIEAQLKPFLVPIAFQSVLTKAKKTAGELRTSTRVSLALISGLALAGC
jgi:hypothetical protein